MKLKITLLTTTLLLLLSIKQVNAQSLQVDFGNPPVTPPDPVFVVENMLPGDEEEREIKVKNVSDSPIPVNLYSQKTEEEIPNWPTTPDGDEFSELLEFEILENSTEVYGTTSLQQFFIDSESGLNLGQLNANEEKIFRVKVKFPSSAGNEYQLAKVVFDLMFEQFQIGSIVINEVYYHPDADHGKDCTGCSGNVNTEISGNAAGSTNIIDINIGNTCIVVQTNNANVNNNANSNANTGGNSASGNTGGFFAILTGNARGIVSIFNRLNINVGSCDKIPGRVDEWVELYNGSSQTVNLKDWKLVDNSGSETIIHRNVDIEPGEFVLISKSNSTWRFWDEDGDAIKIPVGSAFGDGLDNNGDHLYLKNASGLNVDFMAWGDDTDDWNPAVTAAAQGNSLERKTPGLDTDTVDDWEERDPPTPGS